MKKSIISLAFLLLAVTVSAQLHYTNVASDWGVNHSYLSPRLGGGISCYDFDGDGWDDITLATADGETIYFYKNMNGVFMRLPDLVPTEEEAKQILWVDFDNDGDQDLFVASFNGVNRLYEQTEPLEFTDITITAGLFGFHTDTYGACFGDYNRDGWIDLYYGIRLLPSQGGDQHVLFHNNGDGTFTNITAESNTADGGGRPFCSGFIDYNNDLWPDIYTAHDRYPNANTLLENQGDGTFINQGEAAEAAISIDAMSVTLGDYNNDSFFDILCTNTSEGTNLLHNNGPNENGQYTFTETGISAGVGFFGTGWGSSFFDADNDGDLDLYISAASVGSDVISAAFYTNENDGTFSQPMAGFMGDTTSTYNNATGDFNNDGYPEIAVINTYPFHTQLWSSAIGNNNNWVKLKLQGIESNRNGIGSRIECYTNDRYQQRYTQCGNGFMGQHSGTEIIGLGTAELIDSLIVSWPSGQVDRHYDLVAQTRFLLLEGHSAEELPPQAASEYPPVVSQLEDLTVSPVLVYPSPGTDELNITQEKLIYTHFLITNSLGQTVLSGELTSNNAQLDLTSHPAGMYNIHLFSTVEKRRIISWIKN